MKNNSFANLSLFFTRGRGCSRPVDLIIFKNQAPGREARARAHNQWDLPSPASGRVGVQTSWENVLQHRGRTRG